MCDPITLAAATAAIGVGKAVSSYVGQNQAYSANKLAANLTAANQHDTLNQKATELDQQKSENAFDTAITSIQSEGSIAASASDSGLASDSIIHAINTGMFGIGRQASAEDTNDRNARLQLGNEATGVEITRQSSIAKMTKASGLSLALGIGDAALGAAKTYQGAGGK